MHDLTAWFCIQTAPQAEKKADTELRRAGLRVYLPKRSYEVRNRKGHGEPKVRFRPLMIGYLFIKFPPALCDRHGRPQFGAVRTCQGVKGYVRVADEAGEWKPIGIPEHLVLGFMRRQRAREFGRPAVFNEKKRLEALRVSFSKGDSVRVTDGPFAGFLAELEKINSNFTVDAEVMLFGRPTRINVGIGGVEAIDAREAA